MARKNGKYHLNSEYLGVYLSVVQGYSTPIMENPMEKKLKTKWKLEVYGTCKGFRVYTFPWLVGNAGREKVWKQLSSMFRWALEFLSPKPIQ